jgi:eukaryotic-like serine/threonine-protein kinase
LSEQGQCLESGNGLLSYYMAPEQAMDDARALTRRADIYSLGVILHELLTGRVPYEGLPFAAWISELVSPDPVRALRDLEPKVNPHLELICLKCLEKDPNRRYAAADLLAEDLERVLQGWSPRHAAAENAMSRALRWVRRRPLHSALVAGAALFGLVLVLSVLSMLQIEREQQRAALETNAFIANSQAGALLFQLREFADRAERCAQKPGVRLLLENDTISGASSPLESCARGFQAVYLSSTDGRLLAQWPLPSAPILGRNYAFREYFKGARYLGEQRLPGAFLSPAYRAESNGLLQFAVAAPVFDRAGVWIGVVELGQAADSAIGQIRMQDSSESGRIVALLGPRGKDRLDPDTRQAVDFDFIVHPRLEMGSEVAVQEPVRLLLQRAFSATVTPGEQFSLRWAPPLLLSDYRDPLLEPAHESLAAFAPVGQTGYVVVVETTKHAVQRDGRALLHKLAWRVAIPLAVGILGLGFWVFSSMRRKRSLQTRLRRRTRSAPTPDALR